MFKLRILSVGKNKEEWLKQGIEEYTKRLSYCTKIDWVLTKEEKELEKLALLEPDLILLDLGGKSFTSEGFSEFLEKQLERAGGSLSFLIGGATGIPEQLKGKRESFSLSQMTFTHQMTRLILLEQIYRAFEIRKGSLYHK